MRSTQSCWRCAACSRCDWALWPLLRSHTEATLALTLVVCCAGAIGYSGPFVPNYRSALFADWCAKLDTLGLPHSPHASLTKTLADPVQVSVYTVPERPVMVPHKQSACRYGRRLQLC